MRTRYLHAPFGLLVLLLGFHLQSAAQQYQCGSYDYLQQQLSANPNYQLQLHDLDNFTDQLLGPGCARISDAVITIPVVFHVLHYGEPIGQGFNISDARLMAQLDVLNEDFARLNADASNTPAAFMPFAANTKIQFCLAQRDPTCLATNGIIRRQTHIQIFSLDDDIKRLNDGGSDPWPTHLYLNIWIGNLIPPYTGYAQFPYGNPLTDGIVLHTETVGGPNSPGTSGNYGLGRTATHEVGHWLNLRHVWGDDGTLCTGSDQVGDTPNQAGPNFGCVSFPSITCPNSPDGDMFMNYMDYTHDACKNMFTRGQADRMWATFQFINSPRASLLSSLGCVPPPAGGGNINDPWAQDTQEDAGNEPNTESGEVLWGSEDIWVRNFDDNQFIHQNPRADTVNWIYVRIRNRSCATYTGGGQVKVHWAKAGTGLSWPDSWDGSITSPALMGDEVASSPQILPSIPPGESVIAKFAWTAPNPDDYIAIDEPWHFCLLARIGTPHTPETANLYANVRDNNNIIWRNISIVHSPVGMMVRNGSSVAAIKNLGFKVPQYQIGNSILDISPVTVRLSNALYDIWALGGKLGQGISENADHSISILSHEARITNLNLPPQINYRLAVEIPHSSLPLPIETYRLNVIQYDSLTATPDGGEEIVVTSCVLNTPEMPDSQLVITGTHPTCAGGMDGTVSLDNAGYISPTWVGPNSFTANNVYDLAGLEAGTYTVNVTDQLGSVRSGSIVLVPPPSSSLIRLSTGRNISTTSLLNPGDTDYNWAVLKEAGAVLAVQREANVIFPHPYWDSTITDCRWLGTTTAPGTSNRPVGEYEYERRFDISDLSQGLQLNLSLWADNSGSVWLNGQQVMSIAHPGWVTPVSASITNHFVLGTNSLIVKIVNEGPSPSPCGFALRAELTSCLVARSLVDVDPQQEVPNDLGVSIHPNPAKDVLHVTVLPGLGKVQYQVFDLQGRNLIKTTNADIDVAMLPAGLYLLKVVSTSGMATVHFVVE